jgi:hypothetical protein
VFFEIGHLLNRVNGSAGPNGTVQLLCPSISRFERNAERRSLAVRVTERKPIRTESCPRRSLPCPLVQRAADKSLIERLLGQQRIERIHTSDEFIAIVPYWSEAPVISKIL